MNPSHMPSKNQQTNATSSQHDENLHVETTQPLGSSEEILHLQRTIGNRATIQHLGGSATQVPQGVMQRKLHTELTHSAGFKIIGTSTYGQIKEAVVAYNKMPIISSAQIRLALAKLTTITGLIDTWTRAHLSKTKASESEKADELSALAAEITGETEMVSARLEALLNQEREELESAELKAAADAVGYSPLYTTPEFTQVSRKAGLKWLNTPALAPVFRYHIILQHEKISLEAYDEIGKFAGGRTEAVALINKYKLLTTDILNITGEGTTLGLPGMATFRTKAAEVLASPAAVVAANFFGQVHEGLSYSLNELFATFDKTATFRRITQP